MFAAVFLMHDDLDGRRKLDVPTHVITVRVCIDDGRDGLRRQVLDAVEDRLAPPGVLRIHNHHARRADEDSRVTAPSRQHEQVVAKLFDFDHFGRGLRGTGSRLLRGGDRQRQGTDGQ
jgi:hypothetical protein